jgi:hypothetical protein
MRSRVSGFPLDADVVAGLRTRLDLHRRRVQGARGVYPAPKGRAQVVSIKADRHVSSTAKRGGQDAPGGYIPTPALPTREESIPDTTRDCRNQTVQFRGGGQIAICPYSSAPSRLTHVSRLTTDDLK